MPLASYLRIPKNMSTFFLKFFALNLKKKTHWKTLFFESVFFKDETQNIFFIDAHHFLKKLINFLATLTKTSTLLTK